MTSIDDFKKFAKDALDTITDVSVEAYKLAEEKAKIVKKWTKLKTEIALDKSHIRRLKAEMGQIYYDNCKDDPSQSLKQHCEDVTAALDRITAKQKELEDIKNKNDLTDEDLEEYETILDEDDASDE